VEIGKIAGETPPPQHTARHAHFMVRPPNSKSILRNPCQGGIAAIFEAGSLLPVAESSKLGAGIDLSTLPTANI